MIIIGLNGSIGSGKDTFADYLVNNYGFIKLSMSDPLKEACSKLFDIDINYFNDRTLKESILTEYEQHSDQYSNLISYSSHRSNYITPRYIMRTIGTEVTREYFPNHFIKIMKKRINNLPFNSKIIIPDIRFNDEYRMVKNLGGKIIKITTNNIKPINKNNHISDIPFKNYDDIIFNDKTNNYYNEIDKLMKLIN